MPYSNDSLTLQPDQPPNNEASGVIWTDERDRPETRVQSLSKYVSLSVSEGSMNNECDSGPSPYPCAGVHKPPGDIPSFALKPA